MSYYKWLKVRAYYSQFSILNSQFSILRVFKYISRLTIKLFTYCLKRRKAYSLSLASFQYRQVRRRNIHSFRQFRQRHLTLSHHHIQINYNRHYLKQFSTFNFQLSNSQVLLFLYGCCLTQYFSYNQHNQPQQQITPLYTILIAHLQSFYIYQMCRKISST